MRCVVLKLINKICRRSSIASQPFVLDIESISRNGKRKCRLHSTPEQLRKTTTTINHSHHLFSIDFVTTQIMNFYEFPIKIAHIFEDRKKCWQNKMKCH